MVLWGCGLVEREKEGLRIRCQGFVSYVLERIAASIGEAGFLGFFADAEAAFLVWRGA